MILLSYFRLIMLMLYAIIKCADVVLRNVYIILAGFLAFSASGKMPD